MTAWLLVAALLLCSAPGLPAETVSLNGTWQFALARQAGEVSRLEQAFYKPAFDASSFRPIRVPSNWAMEGFEKPQYGRMKDAGTGFYLHRFRAPAEWKDRRVLLQLDGVWNSAEVWLNGVNLGHHDSGFTSFAFQAHEHLKFGESNTLAVDVRQIARDYTFDVNDDWSLGGIYRDVWMECMPRERYLDHVDSWVKFDAGLRDADLHVRALVQQGRAADLTGSPYAPGFTLIAADGRVAAEAAIRCEPHRDTGREHLVKLRVRAPSAGPQRLRTCTRDGWNCSKTPLCLTRAGSVWGSGRYQPRAGCSA